MFTVLSLLPGSGLPGRCSSGILASSCIATGTQPWRFTSFLCCPGRPNKARRGRRAYPLWRDTRRGRRAYPLWGIHSGDAAPTRCGGYTAGTPRLPKGGSIHSVRLRRIRRRVYPLMGFSWRDALRLCELPSGLLCFSAGAAVAFIGILAVFFVGFLFCIPIAGGLGFR